MDIRVSYWEQIHLRLSCGVPAVFCLQTTEQWACLRSRRDGCVSIHLSTLHVHPPITSNRPSIRPFLQQITSVHLSIHCPSIYLCPSIYASFIHPSTNHIHSPHNIHPSIHYFVRWMDPSIYTFTHLSVHPSMLLPSIFSLINPPLPSITVTYMLHFTHIYRTCSSSRCGLHHTFPRMNLESVSPLEAASDLNPRKETSAGM